MLCISWITCKRHGVSLILIIQNKMNVVLLKEHFYELFLLIYYKCNYNGCTCKALFASHFISLLSCIVVNFKAHHREQSLHFMSLAF